MQNSNNNTGRDDVEETGLSLIAHWIARPAGHDPEIQLGFR